jgi:hypothetical protein
MKISAMRALSAPIKEVKTTNEPQAEIKCMGCGQTVADPFTVEAGDPENFACIPCCEACLNESGFFIADDGDGRVIMKTKH